MVPTGTGTLVLELLRTFVMNNSTQFFRISVHEWNILLLYNDSFVSHMVTFGRYKFERLE